MRPGARDSLGFVAVLSVRGWVHGSLRMHSKAKDPTRLDLEHTTHMSHDATAEDRLNSGETLHSFDYSLYPIFSFGSLTFY